MQTCPLPGGSLVVAWGWQRSRQAEYDSAVAEKLVSELEGKTIHEVVAAGKARLLMALMPMGHA